MKELNLLDHSQDLCSMLKTALDHPTFTGTEAPPSSGSAIISVLSSSDEFNNH